MSYLNRVLYMQGSTLKYRFPLYTFNLTLKLSPRISKNVSFIMFSSYLWSNRCSLLEKSSHVSKFSLERVVVRPVLLQQLIVVLAVLLQVLACLTLLEVGIAALANPGHQVASGGEGCAPLISEKVVVAVLQLETHFSLLLQGGQIVVEASILKERGPLCFV